MHLVMKCIMCGSNGTPYHLHTQVPPPVHTDIGHLKPFVEKFKLKKWRLRPEVCASKSVDARTEVAPIDAGRAYCSKCKKSIMLWVVACDQGKCTYCPGCVTKHMPACKHVPSKADVEAEDLSQVVAPGAVTQQKKTAPGAVTKQRKNDTLRRSGPPLLFLRKTNFWEKAERMSPFFDNVLRSAPIPPPICPNIDKKGFWLISPAQRTDECLRTADLYGIPVVVRGGSQSAMTTEQLRTVTNAMPRDRKSTMRLFNKEGYHCKTVFAPLGLFWDKYYSPNAQDIPASWAQLMTDYPSINAEAVGFQLADFPHGGDSKILTELHMECLPLIEHFEKVVGTLPDIIPATQKRDQPTLVLGYFGAGQHSGTGAHRDKATAVNVMMQSMGGPLVPGALWLFWRRRHALQVLQAIGAHGPLNQGNRLTEQDIDNLRAKGCDPIIVEQYPGDAVYIPIGMWHQVTNLHPCVKVARDYLPIWGVESQESFYHETRSRNAEPPLIHPYQAALWWCEQQSSC